MAILNETYFIKVTEGHSCQTIFSILGEAQIILTNQKAGM